MTAYDMRISGWSSDVCSSDLDADGNLPLRRRAGDHPPEAEDPHGLQLLDLPPLRRAVGLLQGLDGSSRGVPPGDSRIFLGPEEAAVRPLRRMRLHHVLGAGIDRKSTRLNSSH